MKAAFRLGDRVQTCEWDADEQRYEYGPVGRIIRVYDEQTRRLSMPPEPAYDVRNDRTGRICFRFEWEVLRVPACITCGGQGTVGDGGYVACPACGDEAGYVMSPPLDPPWGIA